MGNNRHIPRHRSEAPSVASISVLAGTTVAGVLVTFWLATGEVETARDLAGVAMGFVLTAVLMVQALARVIDRFETAESIRIQRESRGDRQEKEWERNAPVSSLPADVVWRVERRPLVDAA